ncbi:MAG: NACHT domain-containing protein [Actinomycetota bacterium]
MVIVLAGALAFSGIPDQACEGRNMGCGFVANIAFTSILGLAGYLYFVTFRRRRTLKRYLRDAKRIPERLFKTPPAGIRVEEVIGRDQLYERVVAELQASREGGAVLVLGETGSGKTTFLLGMTGHLARIGAIPINISLRGQPAPLQLRKLARQQFLDYIDIDLRAGGDADRVWRTLSTERSVVVLADGLDEAAHGSSFEGLDAARKALDAAGAAQLPILITSRLETAPPSGEFPAFTLEPLGSDEAVEYILARAKRAATARLGNLPQRDETEYGKEVGEIVQLADIARTPFYLNLTADLIASGNLDRFRSQSSRLVRVGLLSAYVGAIGAGDLAGRESIHGVQRESVIAALGPIARAMTWLEKLEVSLADLRQAEQMLGRFSVDGPDIGSTVEDATLLGFLQTHRNGGETFVRFAHLILHSYFLQRTFQGKDVWRALIEHTQPAPPAELISALILWCEENHRSALAESRPPSFELSTSVAGELLDRSRESSGDAAMRMVVAALELIRELPNDEISEFMGTSGTDAWRRSSRPAKVAATAALRALDCRWGYSFLYEQTADPDYAARWEASQALIDGGPAALSAFYSHIDPLIEFGEREAPTDPKNASHFGVAILGWLLPALSSTLQGDERAQLETYVEQLIEILSQPDVHEGIQASLAQGMKIDALRNSFSSSPGEHILRFDQVLHFLEEAHFFYSRIMLLHAISLRCISAKSLFRQTSNSPPDIDVTEMKELRERVRRTESTLRSEAGDPNRHPFVRRAAQLCIKAVGSGHWEPFVWVDENVVISRATSNLDPDANALVADIVMLLTLIEQDRIDPASQGALRQEQHLPRCLHVSPDRSEFLDGCRCEFGLCPYPHHVGSAAGRSSLSRGFCLELSAARRSRVKDITEGRLSRKATKRFWEEMADRVARS